MRTINLFSKTVLASSLLMVSAVSLAHNGEDHSAPEKMTVATSSRSPTAHREAETAKAHRG